MLDTVQPPATFQKLQEAWILRWNQRIEDAMLSLAQVQVEKQWEQLEVEHLANLSAGSQREEYLEALLLKGSLLRAQGSEQKSSAWLRRVLNKNSELQSPQGFRLLFELGLDSWRREDTGKALDYFLLADRKTRHLTEQVFTQSNILWCLESLDLDRRSIEEKLQYSLSQISEFDRPRVAHVLEQWRAYQMRKKFYTEMEAYSADISGQGLFFKKWIHELPYMQQASLVLEGLNSSYVWQGSYRLRTLAGVWSPADRGSVRIGDAIDRLYLWVWKWLANKDMSKEKINWTLESILQQLELAELNKENSLLLRNACSWLALLDSSFSKKAPKLIYRLQNISSSNYPLLETEFALISCLTQADSADLVKSLSQFPVFELIYQQNQKKNLSEKNVLLPLLQDYFVSKHIRTQKRKLEVAVNCQTNEVHFFKSDLKIRSPKMTLLLALLSKEGSVSFSQLGSEFEDSRTVYNLLARLRKHMSSQAFIVDDQKISQGPKWPRLEIMHLTDLAQAEPEGISSFIGAKVQVVGSEAYLQAARALLPNTFTRKELEAKLKISKATACRMIEEWLTKNWLSKEGQARSIQYQWTQEHKGSL